VEFGYWCLNLRGILPVGQELFRNRVPVILEFLPGAVGEIPLAVDGGEDILDGFGAKMLVNRAAFDIGTRFFFHFFSLHRFYLE
jgi:hypothetical protein